MKRMSVYTVSEHTKAKQKSKTEKWYYRQWYMISQLLPIPLWVVLIHRRLIEWSFLLSLLQGAARQRPLSLTISLLR